MNGTKILSISPKLLKCISYLNTVSSNQTTKPFLGLNKNEISFDTIFQLLIEKKSRFILTVV